MKGLSSLTWSWREGGVEPPLSAPCPHLPPKCPGVFPSNPDPATEMVPKAVQNQVCVRVLLPALPTVNLEEDKGGRMWDMKASCLISFCYHSKF